MRLSLTTLLVLSIACRSDDTLKTANSNPTVTITSHDDGETFLEGYEILFGATVGDQNHALSELEVIWSTNLREVCEDSAIDADGLSLCPVALQEDENTLKIQVNDPDGAAALDSISFEITPTTAPNVELISPTNDGLYYSDQLILFSAVITDAEDSPSELQAVWNSSIDGDLPTAAVANEDGLLEEYLNLTEGEHALTLTVTDRGGKSTAQATTVTVGGPNSAPLCSITSPETGEVYISGEAINFIGSVSDSDVDVATLTTVWRSDKDGDLGAGTVNSDGEALFSTTSLSANTHIIQLDVSDDVGASCTSTTTISVGTPPMVMINDPLSGELFTTGDPITFIGTVTDNEDVASDIVISWVSSIDGVFSNQAANSNGDLYVNTTNLSAGEHTITVTATDPIGLTDSQILTVVVNTLPTAPTVTLLPSPAYTDDELVANATGSFDLDGDAITYLYQWYRNGTLTSNSAASQQATGTAKGELWSVRVTPDDGLQSGTYTETNIVISNSPPLASSVSISPALPNTEDLLSCNVSVFDTDGDLLTENWSWLNTTTGAVLGTGSNLQLTSDIVSPGDTIECTYDVTDGSDSDGSSSSVYVSNTGPTVTSVIITPSVAFNDTILTCTMEVDDPDQLGTTSVYLWTNDSTGDTLGTAQILALDSSMASPFDDISCAATAVDPSGATGSGSITVNLDNREPLLSAITITPNAAVLGDTLTCSPSTSDADNEQITETILWTNSAGIVMSNTAEVELDPVVVSGGETLTCTVFVEDESGSIVTDSNNFTIGNTGPTVDSLAITPASASSSDTLTCAGTSSDVDGDALSETYTWTNASTGVALGNGASLTLTPLSVTPGDSIICTYGVSDASQTDSQTAVLIVDNTIPIITNVVLTPTFPYLGQTLTCTATIEEPDLESTSVSKIWTNDTTGQAIGSGDTLFLDAINAEPTDAISCEVIVQDASMAITTDQASTTIVNQAPSVDSIALSALTADIGDSVECTATVSDVEGEILSIDYVWDNVTQGTILGTQPTLALVAGEVTGNDQIRCTATTIDSYGATDSLDISLEINPSGPEFDIVTSITPATNITTSSFLSCTGVASDPDGGVISYDYHWQNLQTGQVLGAATSLTLDPSMVQPSEEVSCTITATDPAGDSAASSSTVMLGNLPPTISNIAISPASGITTTSTLSCSASISDPDNEVLTPSYEWTSGGTVLGAGDSITLDPGSISSGATLRCTISVQDAFGASASESTMVTLNSAPTIDSISLSQGSLSFGDTITCTAIASDIDGDNTALSYQWNNLSTSTTVGSNPLLAFDASMGTGGDEIECTATATDTYGATASSTISVTVNSTEPTFVNAASISPNNGITTSSVLTCNGLASDPDGGTITYSYNWSSALNGNLASTQAITLDSGLTQPADQITCTIIATDPAGDTASSFATVLVGNQAPSLAGVTVSPATGVSTSSTLTCAGTSSDADGENLTETFSWTAGGVSLGDTASITLTPATVSPGAVVSCTMTVTDSFGASASGSATVTIDNTGPSISGLSISPDPSFNDSTLTCAVTASDADGETLLESFSWDNLTTGLSLGTGASITLSSADASRNDSIQCTATVADPTGAQDSASTSLTLSNRAPNAPQISISPDPASSIDQLTCTVNSSDPDGDAVTISYAWAVNGTLNAETSNVLGTASVTGDVIDCIVSLDDGALITTGTASITISNTVPSVDSISFSPNTIQTNDLLTAVAVTSDIDGDALTLSYLWYVDGTLVQTGASDTLDGASFFDKGETVTVTVTADDGTNTSSATSSGITCDNTAPTAPTVTVSPSNPVEGSDDLVCSIDTAATDDDGDSIGYTFSWTADGNSFAGANDSATTSTVDASITAAGEIWSCTATPTDGTTTGSASSASSVTIDSAVTESCLDVLNNGNTTDGIYTLNFANGTTFDVYCDLNTDGGGWTLYAITSSSNCAETLSYGSNEITSPSGSAYVSTLMKDFNHSEFLQDFRSGGSSTTFTAVWSFSSTKTLEDRFNFAVSSGESVSWVVSYSGSIYTLSGTWRFSNNAGTSSKWGSSGSNFSNDDGIWGAGSGTLDGNNPGPSLGSGNQGWGHQNYDASDSSCASYYLNGSSQSSSSIKNLMFLR